ncbi:N-acetyltransferase family protein [Terriglobus sp.]|uniref:GNAT family N-acetyltransferase n=1 Tax=Terriglobus sp. TaxID=1889013 RepID=UPI003B00E546
MQIVIRAAEPEDWLTWERLRYALWPGDDEAHGEEISRFFAGEKTDPEHVLLAEAANTAVGFAELSIRTDLPGLEGKRVGYIEGLYVAEQARHQGVARTLLWAARQWAREQGCETFASDREDRIIVDRNFNIPGRAVFLQA